MLVTPGLLNITTITTDYPFFNLIKKLATKLDSRPLVNPEVNPKNPTTQPSSRPKMSAISQKPSPGRANLLQTENRKIVEVATFSPLWKCSKLDLKSTTTRMLSCLFNMLLTVMFTIKVAKVDIHTSSKNSPVNTNSSQNPATSTKEKPLVDAMLVMLTP